MTTKRAKKAKDEAILIRLESKHDALLARHAQDRGVGTSTLGRMILIEWLKANPLK